MGSFPPIPGIISIIGPIWPLAMVQHGLGAALHPGHPADTHGPRRVLSLFLDLATYRATSVASFCLGLALEGGLRLTGLNV